VVRLEGDSLSRISCQSTCSLDLLLRAFFDVLPLLRRQSLCHFYNRCRDGSPLFSIVLGLADKSLFSITLTIAEIVYTHISVAIWIGPILAITLLAVEAYIITSSTANNIGSLEPFSHPI